jgi:hypothetical protein
LLDAVLAWTVDRVKDLQRTIRDFRFDPCSVTLPLAWPSPRPRLGQPPP